eukprot:7293940-Pyramimonas_sp.AAC.1
MTGSSALDANSVYADANSAYANANSARPSRGLPGGVLDCMVNGQDPRVSPAGLPVRLRVGGARVYGCARGSEAR